MAMRLSKRRAPANTLLRRNLPDEAEQLKASVRAKNEDLFRVIKTRFGFTKVR